MLVIAGEGPLRADLERQAEALGPAVRFLGNRNDVPALLAIADVFVMPSLWEGQPLILQEALRAGRPIVATRVGGVPDLTGGEAALLVPPGNAGQLADAIRSLLGDPALAARLRKAAAERARSLPSEEDAVAAVLDEYSRFRPALCDRSCCRCLDVAVRLGAATLRSCLCWSSGMTAHSQP
jgi:glycosyltransferase involved in cell wall biosynthesis